MSTLLNSIAIICIAITYVVHLFYFHIERPRKKFKVTKEDLERNRMIQEWLKKSNKAGEEFSKKAQEILSNVHTSDRNS